MAPKTYGDEDEEPESPYRESSDDDFNPDSAPADDIPSSSEDEDAATAPTQRKGKRKAPVDDQLDSGDEVTIEAARKKSKKRSKGSKDHDEDLVVSEDEGEGGLIKTRAQRAVEKKERKPLARTEGATVDVEALWAQMTAAPLRPAQTPLPSEVATPTNTAPAVAPTNEASVEEELVAVTKTYTFAGQNTTEEKQIPRSALAKYTSEGWKPTSAVKKLADGEGAGAPNAPASSIRRPLKRPSRFDPNPSGYVRALAPEHQLTWPRKTVTSTTIPAGPALDGPAKPEKATKLNVVDKSRMDWTGFVDKEGIAEELHEHGKTKDNYLGRMDFLAGVEQRREEEGRRGRVAATATATATN